MDGQSAGPPRPRHHAQSGARPPRRVPLPVAPPSAAAAGSARAGTGPRGWRGRGPVRASTLRSRYISEWRLRNSRRAAARRVAVLLQERLERAQQVARALLGVALQRRQHRGRRPARAPRRCASPSSSRNGPSATASATVPGPCSARPTRSARSARRSPSGSSPERARALGDPPRHAVAERRLEPLRERERRDRRRRVRGHEREHAVAAPARVQAGRGAVAAQVADHLVERVVPSGSGLGEQHAVAALDLVAEQDGLGRHLLGGSASASDASSHRKSPRARASASAAARRRSVSIATATAACPRAWRSTTSGSRGSRSSQARARSRARRPARRPRRAGPPAARPRAARRHRVHVVVPSSVARSAGERARGAAPARVARWAASASAPRLASARGPWAVTARPASSSSTGRSTMPSSASAIVCAARRGAGARR